MEYRSPSSLTGQVNDPAKFNMKKEISVFYTRIIDNGDIAEISAHFLFNLKSGRHSFAILH